MKILCSTGAFTRDPGFTDHRAIVEHGPSFAVDGFEVIFYPDWYPIYQDVVDDLKASGLAFPVVHAEKNIGVAFGNADEQVRSHGVALFERNCAFAQEIGAEILVLHLWGWPQSDEYIERNIQPLKQCLDIAANHRVTLAIETIPCKVSTPLQNLSQAIEHDPRCRIALDTEFLANHNQLDEIFQTEWAWEQQRVQHIHIKDFDGQAFYPNGRRKYLHPGEGSIDFQQFFAGLRQRAFTGSLTLESPALDANGQIDKEKIQSSLQFIRELSLSHS